MPAIVANANNFILNTDYPMDQIIYMTSGSYTQVGSGDVGTTISIPHGLSFRPLLIGSWSTLSDFSITKEMFMPIYSDVDGTYVSIYSNDTNLLIHGFKNTTGNQTIYYRVFGFMPSNVNVDVNTTASNSDIFVFSTDYNYTKLLYSGIATAAATTTITHNLGYNPQVIAWAKDISITYGTGVINQDYDSYITVTTTTVVIHSTAKDVHYRIYADGQL